jgi:hypothetical protein
VLKKYADSDPRAVSFREFQLWLLEEFVDPGLEVSCRHPVVQAILALSILKIYLDMFGQEDHVQRSVFTNARVSSLLACQASEFTEVRSRARQMCVNL